ncbi:hypothetical protein LOK49_LG05G03376 [Camellia lanceoleosa]|uniref:Uncharacterized protein n=1 Tax=Camellia lanceoleosa TaxID=1840588 RepID=A0ACC0HKF3_9ERIC|nr:hypothetical protein LOK49_LG05G03376 [Camellia lanceoleosa]
MEQRGLVKWVREKINESVVNESWLEEIIDPVMMKSRYDASKMKILIKVALQCVVEDKDARPTIIPLRCVSVLLVQLPLELYVLFSPGGAWYRGQN